MNIVHLSFENKGDIIHITIQGRLEFSHNAVIQEKIEALIKENRRKPKIIIDIHELKFIGSSGVRDLIFLFKKINRITPRPRFVGVTSEFLTLFTALEGRKKFYLYKDRQTATNSFDA
ncbi:MAG: STAS domain-containing protein [Deltaproteobacteria bacterium]|nr:STAS domain-containing protein [Deltaproteobacteria bacterium]